MKTFVVIALIAIACGILYAKDEKSSKSLKDVFSEQQDKINEMLDGTFKEKLEELKGHPKMNLIRKRSAKYCDRLFNALRLIINDAKRRMNNFRDHQQKIELEDLYRDIVGERKKCKNRFY